MKAKHLEDQVIGDKTEKIIVSIESEHCPRCAKGTIVTDNSSGEFLCSSCGFVVTERTQAAGSEWRA
ncbi:MAG: TFIIB-type zinc ribbon-containing protein, partial [Nitrososphaerales archaeon]